MPSPIQAFEANIRPAELLLRVYRLLECEHVETEGELVGKLRTLVKATPDEDVMLVYNEVFLGLIRESAHMGRADIKRSALDHLLRQAIVAAATGLDTYLPLLLRTNLPTIIQVRGRDFIPPDKELQEYFKGFTFTLSETLRLLEDPGEGATLFIAQKMLNFMSYRYLSSNKGITVVGSLLWLKNPWEQIGHHLERNASEMEAIVKRTTDRRNDIVHRADRSEKAPEDPVQTISLAFAQQAVDTIKHVCMALDELIEGRMAEFRAEIQTRAAEA